MARYARRRYGATLYSDASPVFEPVKEGVAASPPRHRTDQLTTVRFLAALWVVIYHTAPRPVGGPAVQALVGVLDLGFTAVGFFFVLSGFILATVYPTLADRIAIRRFWGARIARIFPVYLFALALDLPRLLSFRIEKFGLLKGAATSLGTFFAQSAMFSAWVPVGALNYPSWSVATEIFFYLFYPAVIVVLGSKRKRSIGSALSMVAMALSLILLIPLVVHQTTSQPPAFLTFVLERNPLVRLPEFVVGILLADIHKRLSERRLRRIVGRLLLAAGAIGIIGVTLFAADLPSKQLQNAALIPFYAGLILGLALNEGHVRRTLSTAPAVLLGESSYALYLIHAPAWTLFSAAGGGAESINYVLYLVCTIAASIAVYVAIERPARYRLRRRFISRTF